MNDRQKDKLLHTLVRSARITNEHPGYVYEYFQSFEEVNAYFTSICGEDWISQEWVAAWLNKEKKDNAKDS